MNFEVVLHTIAPRLRQIACKYRTAGACMDENDLFAEMTSYLWERWACGDIRGKTESYIVQSCYFHLRNYLRTTREAACRVSMDERARGAGRIDDGDDGAPCLGDMLPDGERDLPAITEGNALYDKIMSNGFLKIEKEIVRLLCDGYNIREIGRMLNISHVMVVKHKKHIAQKVSRKYGRLLS